MNIEEKRFREYIENVCWKFAKTYAHTWPYEYTVRDWRPDIDDEFAWAAQSIRNHGKPEKFFENTYIYLYLDGMKYWTMGDLIDETTLINRAAVEIPMPKTQNDKPAEKLLERIKAERNKLKGKNELKKSKNRCPST